MNISLEYYKFFYYAAKCGSITQAAEALSVTQPAVSQALRTLAKSLGTDLFVRNGKGVHLTPAGEILFDYVKRGYEEIETGERKVLEMINMETGEIRIGASDMTLQFYLLPYLEAFHEKFSQIKVTVTNAPSPETLKHLQNGKIDFGIVSTPVQNRYDFKMTPVRKIQDVFVAGRKFEYLRGGKLSYKELENLPVMCLEGNTSTRSYVEDYLAQRGTFIRPEFELATSDMLIQFAVRNLGVASVISDFAEKYIRSGELFALKFDRPIPEREFCIVSNERAPMSAAAEKLYRFLMEQKY